MVFEPLSRNVLLVCCIHEHDILLFFRSVSKSHETKNVPKDMSEMSVKREKQKVKTWGLGRVEGGNRDTHLLRSSVFPFESPPLICDLPSADVSRGIL